MRRAALTVRSLVLWTVSLIHFAVGATFLALLVRVAGRPPADPVLRVFCRNILHLSGASLRIVHPPNLDRSVPHVFVANHVNVFDPFTIGSAIPHPVCGFELESHFKVPIYGFLMRAFGNVPVPDRPSRAGMVRMRALAAETIAGGRSIILFAEGTRTRTGLVGPFRAGALRVVAELGVPIVPVSQVGAFELQHPGKLRLDPAHITVILHEPIVTEGMSRGELDGLADRVREIVRGPVEMRDPESRPASPA